MKNIARKPRYRNKSTRQLIAALVARYAAASVRERKAILNFFQWIIQNSHNRELQDFHIEIRSRVLEVQG